MKKIITLSTTLLFALTASFALADDRMIDLWTVENKEAGQPYWSVSKVTDDTSYNGDNDNYITTVINSNPNPLVGHYYGSDAPANWNQNFAPESDKKANWFGPEDNRNPGSGNANNLSGVYAYTISLGVFAKDDMLDIEGWFSSDNQIVGAYVWGKDADIFNISSDFGPAITEENAGGSGYTGELCYDELYEMGKGIEFETAGEYFLTVLVWNCREDLNSGNPTAIRMELNATGTGKIVEVTPEPATFAIFGFGMIGAAVAARRRNRK